MNKLNKPNFKTYGPFKLWTIENFPFIEEDFDAITNYQLYSKIVEYMKKLCYNQDELQKSQIEVVNYVDNYFKNLDVQEEINNKLDEMAENGDLEELITAYINLKSLLMFKTISDLKSATNLVDGSFVETLGYHNINDDGGAKYIIREIINTDVVDDATIISLTNFPELIAELICDEVNIITFGCYGDGEHDDTTNLNKAINYALTNNKKLVSPVNKTYLVSSSVKFRSLHVDFNGSKITTNDEINILKWDVNEDLDKIENIKIDCNNIATSGMSFDGGRACKVEHVRISNVKNYAIKLPYSQTMHAYEIMFDDIRISGVGTNQDTIGILLNTSDCYFNNIIMIDIKTNFKSTLATSNNISNCHCWNYTLAIKKDSKMFETSESVRWNISNVVCDDIQYFFYLDDYTGGGTKQPFLKVDGLFMLYDADSFNIRNDFTDSIILRVPNQYDTVRISLQNAIVIGLYYDYTGIYTKLLQDNQSFIGNIAGSTLASVINIGRNSSVNITNSNFTPITNSLKFNDSNMVELNLMLSFPDSQSNQAYVTLGTIPEIFRPSTKILGSAIISGDYYNDNNSEIKNCYLYIDNSTGNIQIATPKSGTSTTQYVKLHITYYR